MAGSGKSAGLACSAGYGMIRALLPGWIIMHRASPRALCPARGRRRQGSAAGELRCVQISRTYCGKATRAPRRLEGLGRSRSKQEGLQVSQHLWKCFSYRYESLYFGTTTKRKNGLLPVPYTRENPTYCSGNGLPLEGKTLLPIGKNRNYEGKEKNPNPGKETKKDSNTQPAKNPTPSIRASPEPWSPQSRAGQVAPPRRAERVPRAARSGMRSARPRRLGWAPGSPLSLRGQTAPPLPAVVIFILIGDYAPSRHFSAVVGARLGSPAGMGRLVRQQPQPLPAPCAGPRVGRAPGACGGLSGSGDRKAPRLLGEMIGLHSPCRGCLLPVSPLPPVPGRFPAGLGAGSGRAESRG